MAEANVGQAVLELRLDAETAINQLNSFRTQVTQTLDTVGDLNPFKGLSRTARTAGSEAAGAFKNGFKNNLGALTAKPSFASLNKSAGAAGREAATQFKTSLQAAISDTNVKLGSGAFSNVRQTAATSGEEIGESIGSSLGRGLTRSASRTIRSSVEEITETLRFVSLEDALAFSPDQTLNSLKAFRNALVEIRDETNFTTEDFRTLRELAATTDQDIKRITSGTSEQSAAQKELNEQIARAAALREEEARATEAVARAAREAAEATLREENRGRAIGALNSTPVTGRTPGGGFVPGSPADPIISKQRSILDTLQGSVRNQSLDDKQLRKVSNEARSAGLEIKEFVRNIVNGAQSAGTTATAIRSLANAFRELKNNLSFGGNLKSPNQEFVQAVQAETKAGQKLLKERLAEIESVRRTFEVGRLGDKDSFLGFDELIGFGSTLDRPRDKRKGKEGLETSQAFERSPAAISLYIEALEQAQAVAINGSSTFNQLTAEIDRQKQSLLDAAQAAQNYSQAQRVLNQPESVRRDVSERLQDLATRPVQRALPSSELLRADAREITRLNRLSDPGAPLNQAPQGLPERLKGFDANFADAKEFTASLQQASSVTDQVTAALRTFGQALKTTVADPAAAAEFRPSRERRLLPSTDLLNPEGRGIQRLATGAFGNIAPVSETEAKAAFNKRNTDQFLDELRNGAKNDPQTVRIEARKLQNELDEAAVDLGRSLEALNNAISGGAAEAKQKRAQAKAALEQQNRDDAAAYEERKKQEQRTAERQQRNIDQKIAAKAQAEEKERQRGLRIGELRSEDIQGRRRDGSIIAGSPLDRQRQSDRRKERARRNKDIGSNALIGGAFPLLFGQGTGAAAGGAAGGAFGGAFGGTLGFAGSLVGTALGAALDSAAQKATDLAEAFQAPIKNFERLREAALLSSSGLEKTIDALLKAGRGVEASALIRRDLFNQFGGGVDKQGQLEVNDANGRAVARAQARIGNLLNSLAAPLANFIAPKTTIRGEAPTEIPRPEVSEAAFARELRELNVDPGFDRRRVTQRTAQLAREELSKLIDERGGNPFAVRRGEKQSINDRARAQALEEQAAEGNITPARAALTRELQSAIALYQQIADLAKTEYEFTNLASQARATGNQTVSSQVSALENIDQADRQQRQGVAAALNTFLASEKTPTDRKVLDEETARLARERDSIGKSIVANEQAAAVAARETLEAKRALVGLEGEALSIGQQRVQTEQLLKQAKEANRVAESVASNPDSTPDQIDAVKLRADEAASTLKSAGIDLAEAIKAGVEASAERLDRAGENLRATLQGSLRYLTPEAREQALADARMDIEQAVDSGLVDPKFLNSRRPSTILGAASASRNINNAVAEEFNAGQNDRQVRNEAAKAERTVRDAENFESALGNNTTALDRAKESFEGLVTKLPDLISSQENLKGSLDSLVQKEWNVKVKINGESAADTRVESS